MRRSISATEAKNRLADALRQAEGGEVVLITRHGKPSAALVSAGRLERLERLAAAAESDAPGAATPAEPAPGVETPAEPTPDELREREEAELLERAAAGSLRRIEYDLARLPEKLKPVLRLMRKSLFRPRLTVKRIQRVMKVGGHDLTSQFARRTGATIRQYAEDRRLEAAGRLLVDSELEVEAIAGLVGYSGSEAFARAFGRRYGLRPLVYREFDGELSPEVAADAGADRAPLAPRFLAGVSGVAPAVACAGCGGALEPEERLRVFDALAPICGDCAREQAPELSGLLA